MASTPVNVSAQPGDTPNSTKMRRAKTMAMTPDRMHTRIPAKAFVASTGITGDRASSGIVASEGSGFQTKPMAARCGSRLKST